MPLSKPIAGINDLQSQFPEIASEAYEWNPSTVTFGSHQKRSWKCKFDHIYECTIKSRTLQRGSCPICAGKRVLVGFNDLQSEFPIIAKDAYKWDPTTLTSGSGKKVMWKCSKDHIYESIVANRTKGTGCPVCSGQKILIGFNDLASRFPEIAQQADGWNPQTVTANSGLKQKWKCQFNHQWVARVGSRTAGAECPVCTGRRVQEGFNDLKTKFPNLAKEAYGWNPSKISAGSNQKKQWICQYKHIWTAIVSSRSCSARGCPYCAGVVLLPGFNDLKSSSPELAKEAYGWDPSMISAGSNQKKQWICEKGHIWNAVVNSRRKGHGCPVCSGHKLLIGFNDLRTRFPEVAREAYEWDPSAVVSGGLKKYHWKCSKCGHIWSAMISSRISNGSGCPSCTEYGFNPEKDAWFYLMQRPGEQQFGITNDFSTRMRTHERNGWVLLEHAGPASGQKVLDTENAFKQWLKKEVGLIKGTTENWSTPKMEVQSLAELKSKSGIETDLF